MKAVAYDYTAQRWVQGGHAEHVRREQLLDTLAILEGPRGAEYLRFNGDTGTVAEAARGVRLQLEALNP